VSRIADYGLIEVADRDSNSAVGVRNRTEIPEVAITANPNRRALRDSFSARGVEPPIKLNGAAADIGMRGAGHFEGSALVEDVLAMAWLKD
jgi:hypothetical protein